VARKLSSATLEKNRQRVLQWKIDNPERYKEQGRRAYERNKEIQLARAKAKRESDPIAWKERHHWYTLKHRQGITKEEYQNLFAQQDGVCAICSKPYSRLLDVDHDHSTGKIRGLLCGPCNRGLGQFQDNIALLAAAIEYLTRSESPQTPLIEE